MSSLEDISEHLEVIIDNLQNCFYNFTNTRLTYHL